ncbi:MAG: tetratricopeptide repeat protein [Vulcanimicrobiota bacterium]
MSDDLQVLLREAETLYEQSEWDQAQEKYIKILQRDPQNEEACYKIARIYAIRGLISNVVNQYFQLMDILEAKGELDQAVEVARWIQMIQPENDKARMKIILINKRKGNVEEVVKQSLQLARLYIELGQSEQSIMLLQGAQEYVPDNLDIGLELAEMYMSHGNIQEAASQYRKIANAYLAHNQLEKAADAFRRMKVIVSDDEQLLLTLGNIYVNLNRFNEAEAEFRAVLRLDLNNVEALMALGNVCQLKGQFRDAILAFNKILSINPQEVKAKEKLGELHQAQGNHIESIKNYLSAAHIDQSMDETDKAIRLYQRVLTLDPTNPTACRELTNLGAPLVGEEEEEMSAYQPSIVPIPELLPGKFEAGAPSMEVVPPPDRTVAEKKQRDAETMPLERQQPSLASPQAMETAHLEPLPSRRGEPAPHSFGELSFEPPSLGTPSLDETSHGKPTFEPSFGDLSFEPPSLGEITLEPPSMGGPDDDSSLFEAPSFAGPAPMHAEPGMSGIEPPSFGRSFSGSKDFDDSAFDTQPLRASSFDAPPSRQAPSRREEPPQKRQALPYEQEAPQRPSSMRETQAQHSRMPQPPRQREWEEQNDDALLYDAQSLQRMKSQKAEAAVQEREGLFSAGKAKTDRKKGLLMKPDTSSKGGKKKGLTKAGLKPMMAHEDEEEDEGVKPGLLRVKGETGKPKLMLGKKGLPPQKELTIEKRPKKEEVKSDSFFDDEMMALPPQRQAPLHGRGMVREEPVYDHDFDDPFQAPPPSMAEQRGAQAYMDPYDSQQHMDPFSAPPQMEPRGASADMDLYGSQPEMDPFGGPSDMDPFSTPQMVESPGALPALDMPVEAGEGFADDSLLMPPLSGFQEEAQPSMEPSLSDDSLLLPPLGEDNMFSQEPMSQGLFEPPLEEEKEFQSPFGGNELKQDNPFDMGMEARDMGKPFDPFAFSSPLPDISMPGSDFEMSHMEEPFESTPLQPSYDIPSGDTEAQRQLEFPPLGEEPAGPMDGLFGFSDQPVGGNIGGDQIEVPVSFWDSPVDSLPLEPIGGGALESPPAGIRAESPRGGTIAPESMPPLQPLDADMGQDLASEGIDWGFSDDGGIGVQEFSEESIIHSDMQSDALNVMNSPVNEEPAGPMEWELPSEMPPFSILQESLTEEEKKVIFTGIPGIAPQEVQGSFMSRIEEEILKLRDIIEAGDYTSAIETYLKILNDYPGNVELRSELADLYYTYGLSDEALEQFDILIEKEPQRIDYRQKLVNLCLLNQNLDKAIETLLIIARAYKERKETVLALEQFQAILALDKENMDAREEIVDIYMEQKSEKVAHYHLSILANVAENKKDHNKAIDLFRKIYSLTGELETQCRLAEIYEEAGRKEEAENEYIAIAGKFRDMGDDARACRSLERIVEIHPENIDAYYQLIELYQKSGNLGKTIESKFAFSRVLMAMGEKERALEILEEVVKARPDLHEARHTLIDIYLEKHQVDKALVEAHSLADIYFKEKKVDAAIDLYQKLVEADPHNLALRERLAHFYMMSDRSASALEEIITIAQDLTSRQNWDEAIKTYKKALQIDDKSADIRYQLGLILLERKNSTRDALQEFQKVFELDPSHKDNTKKYVEVLLTEGRPEEAMKVLEKLISIDPTHASLKDEIVNSYKKKVDENQEDIQSRFFLGIIFKELRMLDDAIEQFQKTKRLNEYFLQSSNMLAMCFAMKPGMQQIAIRTLKKAIETKEFPEDQKLDLYYNLGSLQEGSNKMQEALACYQEIYKYDLTFKDVAQKIKHLREQSGGGASKVTRLVPRDPGGGLGE